MESKRSRFVLCPTLKPSKYSLVVSVECVVIVDFLCLFMAWLEFGSENFLEKSDRMFLVLTELASLVTDSPVSFSLPLSSASLPQYQTKT